MTPTALHREEEKAHCVFRDNKALTSAPIKNKQLTEAYKASDAILPILAIRRSKKKRHLNLRLPTKNLSRSIFLSSRQGGAFTDFIFYQMSWQ